MNKIMNSFSRRAVTASGWRLLRELITLKGFKGEEAGRGGNSGMVFTPSIQPIINMDSVHFEWRASAGETNDIITALAHFIYRYFMS